MALNLDILVKVGWNFTNVLDLSTPSDQGFFKPKNVITNGTGNNQGDELWHDSRTIAAPSQNDDFDLVGVLTNSFGATVDFATVKGLAIWNRGVIESGEYVPVSGEDMLVGGAGSLNNAWNQLFNGDSDAQTPIHSGGMYVVTSPLTGITVTAGSSDVLRVVGNGSGSNTLHYQIAIWGVKT